MGEIIDKTITLGYLHDIGKYNGEPHGHVMTGYNYLKDKLPLFDLGIKSPGISGIDEEYMLIKSLCKDLYDLFPEIKDNL